jgi:hypothetical protein
MTDDADFERRLLGAARDDEPPRENRERALAAFLASSAVLEAVARGPSAPAPAPAPRPVPASAPRAALPSALKWLVTGAFVGSLATFGVGAALRPPAVAYLASRAASFRGTSHVTLPRPAPEVLVVGPTERARAASPVPSAPSRRGPMAAEKLAPAFVASASPPPSELEPVLVASPAGARSSRSSRSSRPSRLAEEVAILDAARAKLATRDYDGALGATEDYRIRFPSGELARDIDVVVIAVLSAKGSREQAKERARVFLATYPNDPHGSGVRALVE